MNHPHRTYLLAEVANKMASNWIASGDRAEEDRATTERSIRRMHNRESYATLRVMLNQLAYPKGTGE